MCGVQGLLCIIIRGVGGYNYVWGARSFVYSHQGVVWEAKIMCGVHGLLYIIITGLAGGYN